MLFIETPIFTQAVTEHLAPEEYRRLQLALLLRPGQGPILQGGGGVRKVRWATGARGKSGGVRVIYYWERGSDTIYMLYIYPKSIADDLSPQQLSTLRKVVKEYLRDE